MEMSTFPRWLLAASALVMLLLLSGGAWFYFVQENHLRQETQATLEAIAQLKVDQIADWRAERLSDAAVLMESPFFIEGVTQWVIEPKAVATEKMLTRLGSFHRHDRYNDVLVVDMSGKVRLSVSKNTGPLSEPLMQALSTALRERKPVMTALHEGPGDLPPHIDVVAPLLAGTGGAPQAIGAIVLRTNAQRFLYPLVQFWPTPSRTAETLLVRREGDDVLFLNDLRHQSETALRLRIPLTRLDVPAVIAVLGTEGVVQGTDYRGVPVLSVLKKIPDSPWFMVAKVDESEALATWRLRSLLIGGLIASLLGFLATATGLVWQRSGKAHYQALFQSEEARRKSEESYRVTLMSVGDAVIATDAAGMVDVMNPVAEDLTGWSLEQARGRKLEDVFHIVNEETRQPVDTPVQRVMAAGIVVGLANHTVLIARDGRERPIADSGAPIRNDDGTITGVVLVFRDQTHERSARKALRESEQRLAHVLRVSPAIIYILNPNGFIPTWVSPSVERILGFTRDEALDPAWWLSHLHPEDRDRVLGNRASVLGQDRTVHEYRFMKHDGEEMWVHDELIVLRDERDNPVEIVGAWTDITSLKLAEAERERLASAIEQAGEVVVITDVAGTIRYVNPAFEKITGFSREEAIGQNPRMLKSDAHDEEFYGQLWSTITEGHTWTGRLVNRKKDGRLYYEDATISPVRGLSGEIANFVAVKRDVTEHLELSRQFFQAQKMEAVGTLAGGVAHDFNNLLQVVLGYCELMLVESDLSPKFRNDLAHIKQAASTGAELVQTLLTLSRKTEVKSVPLDLNKLIEKLQRMLSRTLPKMIEVELVLARDLAPINANPSQMEQILMNLVVNARDAMPDGGKLVIQTENMVLDEEYGKMHLGVEPGTYVLLSVSDAGQGMDKETLTHIFEPFFTTKGPGQGTGLGLATVYGIVKQHRGHIMCYSEVGKGTIFKMYFPSLARDRGLQEVGKSLPPRGGKETILLIDDEEMVRDLGARILRNAGYRVITASNGREALNVYREHAGDISLVVLDLIMPEMGGSQCLTELLSLNPALKVIVASGFSAGHTTSEALEAGAKGFINKPYNMRQVLEVVRSVLDEKSI
jgi:PAS domain S-box-containing protein